MMKIATRIVFRRSVCMLSAAALFHAAPAFAADFSLDQLMQSLAKVHSAHATFVEKKYLSMLDRPVESSGELFYEAPNHVEKKTLKPKPETLKLDGNAVTVERAGRKRTLQLSNYPELASLIDSIRGTLAGDRGALEHSYRLDLKGEAQAWRLTLTPLDSKVAGTVRLIEILGSEAVVRSIEISQTDGDRSVMNIEPVETK